MKLIIDSIQELEYFSRVFNANTIGLTPPTSADQFTGIPEEPLGREVPDPIEREVPEQALKVLKDESISVKNAPQDVKDAQYFAQEVRLTLEAYCKSDLNDGSGMAKLKDVLSTYKVKTAAEVPEIIREKFMHDFKEKLGMV